MNNAGIDYGRGQANIHPDTGVRYGVISQNSVMGEALEDIIQQGDDIGWENFKNQVIDELQVAVQRVLDDYCVAAVGKSEAEEIYEAYADSLNEGYSMGDSGPWEMSDGEGSYRLDETNVWVFSSIYYTHSKFCSPCMPGAGDLDSPHEDGPKTYCLGPEWFDEYRPCPYPIYRVEDDELIYKPEGF